MRMQMVYRYGHSTKYSWRPPESGELTGELGVLTGELGNLTGE